MSILEEGGLAGVDVEDGMKMVGWVSVVNALPGDVVLRLFLCLKLHWNHEEVDHLLELVLYCAA